MNGSRGAQLAGRLLFGEFTFGVMGIGGEIGVICGVLMAEYARTPFEPLRGFLAQRRGWGWLWLNFAAAMIPLLAISAMDEFGFTVKANPLRFTSMATDVVQGIISFMMMFFIALLLDELPPQQRRLNDAASDAVAALARRVEIVHANPDPVRS